MSKEPLFVTCPVCGKVNQKSIFTYSEEYHIGVRPHEIPIKKIKQN